MKKTILTLCSCFIVVCNYAQIIYKPVKGGKQLSLEFFPDNDDNQFAALFYKSYFDDDKSLRIAIGGASDNNNYYDHASENYYGVKNSNYLNKKNISISLGFQKSFGSLEKFEPYIGGDFVFQNYFYTDKRKKTVTDTALANSYYGEETYVGDFINTSKKQTTLSIVLRPCIGFNYYLTKHLALGLEYQISVLSYNYLDSYTSIKDQRSLGVDLPQDKISYYDNSINSSAFKATGAITVCYSF